MSTAKRETKEIATECVEGLGTRRPDGYRVVSIDGVLYREHRLVVDAAPGMDVHHTCESRGCVNPDHLMVLTKAEHTRLHNTKTECLNGHEYTEENTHVNPTTGARRCRVCRRIKGGRGAYRRRSA